MLNCLEYHRDSEVDICGDDIVLLLAKQSEIIDGQLETSKVKAFLYGRPTNGYLPTKIPAKQLMEHLLD